MYAIHTYVSLEFTFMMSSNDVDKITPATLGPKKIGALGTCPICPVVSAALGKCVSAIFIGKLLKTKLLILERAFYQLFILESLGMRLHNAASEAEAI